MKKLLASALIFFAPLCAQAACSATDFTVQNVRVEGAAGHHVSLKGELVNHCATPAGAKLRIAAKNAAGDVIASHEIWPSGTTNLAPGKSTWFNTGRLFDYRASMKSFAVTVVGTRNW